MMIDDMALVQEYARRNSEEEAFTTLVPQLGLDLTHARESLEVLVVEQLKYTVASLR